MKHLKIALLLSLSSIISLQSQPASPLQKINSSLFASAIGDALGRVTEFIPSVDRIFAKYPNGVKTFKDFQKSDWLRVPSALQKRSIAPYTDDTRMALLVADTLIKSKQNNWDQEKTMSELAKAFIADLDDTTYGWAASFRAPGNACLKGVYTLQRKSTHQRTSGWWDARASQAGGCGSVMRAFPFGLIFSDDPQKAKRWAVEHSKITHGHPIALAACAAMAVGTAYALEGSKDSEAIIDAMIKAAKDYDLGTADMMRTAHTYAREARALLGNKPQGFSIFKNKAYKALHEKVLSEFEGWAAHDAIAATIFVFALFPEDLKAGRYISVHAPGDSDSLAAMSGALIGAYSGAQPDLSLMDSIEDAQRLKDMGLVIHKLQS